MYTNKTGLRKSDVFVGNRNLTRPFGIDSCTTKHNEEEINKNSLTNTFNCNHIANDPSQMKNLKPITLTNKPKRYLHLKLIIILFSILITAFVAIVIMLSLKSPDKDTGICLTSTCLENAVRALTRLDYTIDPCIDFYQFACGKFLKENQQIDSFAELTNDVIKKVMNIINLPVTNNASKIRKAVPVIYDNCMNYRTTWDKETSELKLLFESLGGWPMVEGENWNANKFDLNKLLLRLKKMGILQRSPFQFTVNINWNKKNRYGLFGHSNQPAVTTKLRLLAVTQVALALGGDESIINQDVNIHSNLISDVYKLCTPTSTYLGSLKNLSIWTTVNWTVYVQELFTFNVSITDDEDIFYDANLVKCMNFFFGTPKRYQANYIFIEIVWWLFMYLPGMKNEFLNKEPTSTDCVKITSKSLLLMVNSLYVKMYFKKESKAQVEQLVMNIRNEFKNVLTTVQWFDSNTKKFAIEKIDSMRIFIGYPDELVDDGILEDFYSSLELNLSASHLSIIQSVTAFDIDNKLKLLRKYVTHYHWIAFAEKVLFSAEYYLLDNSIYIPVGMLHETTFNERRPNYLNYATIGMIIGHEMAHGFDNTGQYYDKNGHVVTWWSKETLAAFQNKTQCIINQYKRYELPQLKIPVNGELTLRKNIADNGGLKISYLAYQRWVQRQGVEKMLPGLNYTSDQMFWIAFAQFWCSCKSLHQMEIDIHQDVHAPDMFRVIGTLSNMKRFADDFNCRIGSPMNPLIKCDVW